MTGEKVIKEATVPQEQILLDMREGAPAGQKILEAGPQTCRLVEVASAAWEVLARTCGALPAEVGMSLSSINNSNNHNRIGREQAQMLASYRHRHSNLHHLGIRLVLLVV
jgi:hypothetical protein